MINLTISMRLYILCFFLFVYGNLIGQNNQGQILFEEKVDAHRNLPPEMEMYKDRFPQFRTTNRVLYFTPGEAYYVTKRDESRVNRAPSGDRGRRRFMG
ncbi:MAG: hypothetical protein R3339_05070, partial [Thermodesulfobacteriota bacterium]|nr:hypothetical protein [Thermodesulfobacteriota bacterium]